MAGRRWGVMIGSGIGMVVLGAALAAMTRLLLAPAVKPPDPVPATLPRTDEVAILDDAPLPRPIAKTVPAAGQLPDELQRAEILAAMSRVKPRADRCAGEFHQSGIVTVRMTMTSSGRVSSARAEGEFANTPAGACVEAAARSASFRSFKRPSLTLTYPFLLKE